jgi:RNA recognition motif-containing protein
MNIFVGNLPFEVTEDELKQIFEVHGKVTSVSILKDKFTGKPRGFGFVEMADKASAEIAISALNGKDLKGRNMTVNEARPKTEGHSKDGGRRGGYGGGGRDGYGDGGGGRRGGYGGGGGKRGGYGGGGGRRDGHSGGRKGGGFRGRR